MDQPHNLEQVARKLAKDLVEMHEATAIEIQHWGNALELVSLYYSVDMTFLSKEAIQPVCFHNHYSTSSRDCIIHSGDTECWQNTCDNCNAVVSHETI